MANKGIHCLYYNIKKYLESYNIFVKESDIFQLLGGISFHYHPIKGQPNQFQIFGNNMDIQGFNDNTGIKINLSKEENIIAAEEQLMEKLNDKKQHLVYANCYYLPFDKNNYKKNYDDHLLLVKSYNERSQTYIVSDHKYNEVKIDRNILNEARERLLNGNFLNFELFVENPFKEKESLVNERLKNYSTNFPNHEFLYLISFKSELSTISQLQMDLQKEVSLFNISKVIQGVHGPVNTRKLMRESVKHISSELEEWYDNLSKKWYLFSVELMKQALYTDEINFNKITNKYEEIIQKESECAYKLMTLM